MKAYLLILLLAASATISAQSNFKQGYIITNQNDTIDGWIDYRTDYVNSERCKFRKTLDDVDTFYLPGEISGYRFTEEGKFYVSDEIEIEGTKKQVFLEYLLQGIVSLYHYSNIYILQDEKGERHLISKSEAIETYKKNSTVRYSKEDTKYMGHLKYLLRQSDNAVKKSDKIEYKSKDIIDLVKTYHDDVCTSGEQCVVFETKEDKKYTLFRSSVYGGFLYNRFKLNEQHFGKLGDPINSYMPVIGAQLNASVPRWAKALSLQLDVALSGMNGETEGEYKLEPGYLEKHKYEFDAITLITRFGPKYTFGNADSRIQPIIEGGVNLFSILSCSNTYTVEYDQRYIPIVEKKDYRLPNRVCVGAYLGTGFDYLLKNNKAVIVRLSYDYNETYYTHSKSDTFHNISCKVGYTF